MCKQLVCVCSRGDGFIKEEKKIQNTHKTAIILMTCLGSGAAFVNITTGLCMRRAQEAAATALPLQLFTLQRFLKLKLKSQLFLEKAKKKKKTKI